MRFSWKAIAATAALVVGLAASVAVAATPKSDGTKGRSGKSGSARMRVAPADPQQHLAALAKKLDVTEAQLQSAFDATRDKLGPPGRKPERPSRSGMEKRCNELTDSLASELKLSGDTVRAATKSVAKDEIEAAVKANRLTQDEANRILERINSSDCLPPLGRHVSGGPGCGPPPGVQNTQPGSQGSGLPALSLSAAPA